MRTEGTPGMSRSWNGAVAAAISPSMAVPVCRPRSARARAASVWFALPVLPRSLCCERGAWFAGTTQAGIVMDKTTRLDPKWELVCAIVTGHARQRDLKGADLSFAVLAHADLREADLTEASLIRTSLAAANLAGARMTAADLMSGTLACANLTGADLQEASLQDVTLHGADLTRADLRGAILVGADLTATKGLDHAKLAGAEYDHYTRWPAGFDPRRYGAVRADK